MRDLLVRSSWCAGLQGICDWFCSPREGWWLKAKTAQEEQQEEGQLMTTVPAAQALGVPEPRATSIGLGWKEALFYDTRVHAFPSHCLCCSSCCRLALWSASTHREARAHKDGYFICGPSACPECLTELRAPSAHDGSEAEASGSHEGLCGQRPCRILENVWVSPELKFT